MSHTNNNIHIISTHGHYGAAMCLHKWFEPKVVSYSIKCYTRINIIKSLLCLDVVHTKYEKHLFMPPKNVFKNETDASKQAPAELNIHKDREK